MSESHNYQDPQDTRNHVNEILVRQGVDGGINLITGAIGKKYNLNPSTVEASRVLCKSLCEFALDKIFDKPHCDDAAPPEGLSPDDNHGGDLDAGRDSSLSAGAQLDTGDDEKSGAHGKIDAKKAPEAVLDLGGDGKTSLHFTEKKDEKNSLDAAERGHVKSAAPPSLDVEIPGLIDGGCPPSDEEDNVDLEKSVPPSFGESENDEMDDFDTIWSLIV